MLTLMGGILFVDINRVCEDCVMNMVSMINLIIPIKAGSLM